MKKLYPFATMLLSILSLSNGANAQTYTAVRDGNWHVSSGLNVWDPSGEPPANCNSCVITITTGKTVTLNTNVNLSGNSILQIGDSHGTPTKLVIPGSGGTDFASSYNIILNYDGTTTGSKVIAPYSSASVDATSAGTYDGVLTVYSNVFFKQVGTAPSGFLGTAVINHGPASYGTDLTGVVTLSSNGTLPIVLSGFTVVSDNDAVDLSWTTQVEINSDHFSVERSTDGGAHWQVLGTVPAQGNSSVAVNYSYTDANPAAGVAQYRLQMVDLDKKAVFSPIKTVRTGLITGVSIYPNPARDFVNVSVAGNETSSLSIRLLNQSGQLLAEKKVTSGGGTTVSLPVSTYPAGSYLIMVKGTDGSQQVSKLFISK
jgi:hypothetical protein